MINLAFPWAFLLLPLPLLVRQYTRPHQSSEQLYMPIIARLKKSFGDNSRPAHTSWQRMMLWCCWIALVITLARPEHLKQIEEVTQPGYDIVLAVDLSGSMRALDFSDEQTVRSRLDMTKLVVRDFISKRLYDRIGLVVFGAQAYVYVPLTHDITAVAELLDSTMIGMAGETTAIGDALGIAIKQLTSRPKGSRVIILLTDGADTSSHVPPHAVAKLAHKHGIKIYTIGVGKDGPVPVMNEIGLISMVEMELDEALLTSIAHTTGGQYFHATDPSSLSEIYKQIHHLEKTEGKVQRYYLPTPLYPYPLLFTLTLFLLLIIKERRWCYGL